MAVYKVPQDVEADDKLIGPFSFRQFVFILIMVGFGYLAFVMFQINPLLVVIPLPVVVFFGILGLWPRKDQPVEVYLGALIRFWTKPHLRIWNQEGQSHSVIINAPKRIVHQYTDEMSNVEVKSRLNMLAQTMDTRGWAAKNVEVQDITPSQHYMQQSDRLVMPQAVASQANDPIEIHQYDDMMDVSHNPIAQNFDNLSAKAKQTAKQSAIATMKQAKNQTPAESTDDANAQDIHYDPYPKIHQKVIAPVGDPDEPVQPAADNQASASQEPAKTDENKSTNTMADQPSAAILNIARNSDHLSISTIARQAQEAEQSLHDDETIELH